MKKELENRYTWEWFGLNVVVENGELGPLLTHFSTTKPSVNRYTDRERRWMRLVEIQATGENQDDHHHLKHTGTSPGRRIELCDVKEQPCEEGLEVVFHLKDPTTGLNVFVSWLFVAGVPVVKADVELWNQGPEPVSIEHVSSFNYVGLHSEQDQPWQEATQIHYARSTWKNEMQWCSDSLRTLGLEVGEAFSLNRVLLQSIGTFGSADFLPMGCLEQQSNNDTLFWEILHHGSWLSEVSSIGGMGYLQLSGPSYNEHHWRRELTKGERVRTIPVVVGATEGGFEASVEHLNQFRRLTRRENQDNRECPVIFNDYMNCLFGDPTTEKLIPLIDAAAETGCEYFVIDAGWYDEGSWWDGVGEWLPAPGRFPGGIEEPLNYIRKKGMVPGLWLELEVMGINCTLAKQWPDECFFMRHGRRIIDHGRYQLDFRNAKVIEHADAVVERLVREYQVGYIKMDYNINIGVGTDVDADSPGDGLLQHQRAYVEWLRSTFNRYPNLVIENCSSGGLRAGTSLLRLCSIQSVSDQQDLKKMAVIAAASPPLVPPEQSAVWSYPKIEGELHEVIFNMVSSMTGRIHMSGHLAAITDEARAIVSEGIRVYKTYREQIPQSKAFWPCGIPKFTDNWFVLGLKLQDHRYLLFVWRIGGDMKIVLPVARLPFAIDSARCLFPAETMNARFEIQENELCIQMLNTNTAAVFEVSR